MSALVEAGSGRVEFIGAVRERAVSMTSTPLDEAVFDEAGLQGDGHRGRERASCRRLSLIYPVGTPIRNTRQISIVSREELAAIADAMGIGTIAPEWLGANLMLSGLPRVSLIPPSSRLVFEGGLSLTVDLENAPCNRPALVLRRHRPDERAGFRAAARHRRGVCAWVERPGRLAVGEAVTLWVPAQPLHPAYLDPASPIPVDRSHLADLQRPVPGPGR